MSKINEITLIIVGILSGIFSCQQSHAKSIKVMVIDTGVDLFHKEIKSHVKSMLYDYEDYTDLNSHGTAMASIVLKDTCEQIELVSCLYFDYSNNNVEKSNNCFTRALNEDIQYINYSSYGEQPNTEEKEILKKLTDKGVIVVVAAGNKGINLIKNGKCEKSYPGCYLYDNMFIVQSLDKNGKLRYDSNYLKHPNARSEIGVDVKVLYPGNKDGVISGTSPAAAKYMNSLLLKECANLKK